MFTSWKQRAKAAEAENARLTEAMERFIATTQTVAADDAKSAILVDITRPDKRHVRFHFQRGGEAITFDTVSTWDDDVDGWKRQLLGNK